MAAWARHFAIALYCISVTRKFVVKYRLLVEVWVNIVSEHS